MDAAGDAVERGERGPPRPKLLALPSGLRDLRRLPSLGTPRHLTPVTPRTPDRQLSFGARSTPHGLRAIGATSPAGPGDTEKGHGTEPQDDSLQVPLLGDEKCTGSKAPLVVLGFECLESTAFNGISTNLVMYLETVLHGSNLASASNVTMWFGTSYLIPIFGAIIADAFLGNYTTILVSLIIYLLGMILVTTSAFLPTAAALGVSSVFGAQTVAFVGLYLVAIGSGGLRSSLLPFGAEQFDDDNAVDRESKMSFFSWFYLCVDFGPIVSGLFIVWIQEKISWGLGFGISTACIALAFAAFVLATPLYRRPVPTAKVPANAAGMLDDEASDKVDIVVSESGLKEIPEETTGSSWNLRAMMQGEELKVLLRLLPIWLTNIIVSSAYTQMNTTFIQQGNAMNLSVLSVEVPAASMGSFEVVCVLTWVLLYTKVIVPALMRSGFSFGGDGEPSQLQRMGAGRLLMALAMAVSALVETMRLASAARGEEITIAWQIPQYFLLAGAEVFCYIAQLEFFYAEAPDTMKSTCTSLALLTIALGSYLSSFIYTIVAAFTATAGRPGWIPDDLNQGHLDYFFWAMAALCTLNFFLYSLFAKNYKLKNQDSALIVS
ncbi:unnamed protein product [Urochloa humidicola]